MRKIFSKAVVSAIAAGVLVFGLTVTSLADTVVMNEDGIRVRSSSSTSSSVVTNGAKGDEYKVLETVTGDDGNTWYKIQVNDSSTGYVRGDLVKLNKEAAEKPKEENTEENANTASSLAPTQPTPITETTATIAGNSPVNIRSGAGTGYEKVASIEAGTSINLIGEAKDASGNKWYQFKCDSKNVEGYIRSDLITVSAPPAPAEDTEGEATDGEGLEGEEFTDEDAELEQYEAPVEEEPVGGDYEIVYTTDDDGVYQYYLYDHINNTRQKVNDLLEAITTLNNNYQDVSGKLTTFKILTIAFGALMLVAIIAAVLFFLKSRNGYEEEYYEDDFEDEEPEPVKAPRDDRGPSKNLRSSRYDRNYDEYDNAPSRNREERRASREDKPSREDRPSREERPSREDRRPSRDEASARPQKRPRKAQNFLADDDEFEFEFLNMDDKE